MACFPRFRLHRRQRNSFSPAVDRNTETLLNTDDNSTVQIERYIRREETPLVVATKYSEKPAQAAKTLTNVQQNQQQINATTNNSNGIANGRNDNKTSNTSNTLSANNDNNNNNNSDNNLPKKFISNKGKFTSSSSGNININHSSSGSIGLNTAHGKLRPVKERRPTALPTDIPVIEEDVTDFKATLELHQVSGVNGTYKPMETPSSSDVKFFIGSEVNDAEEDRLSDATIKTSKSTAIDTAPPSARVSSVIDSEQLQQNSTSIRQINYSPKARQSKYPPNGGSSSGSLMGVTVTGKRPTKKGPPPVRQPNEEREPVFIPPPPPLPPQPLTTASSSASLKSQRSGKMTSGSSGSKVLLTLPIEATTIVCGPESAPDTPNDFMQNLSKKLTIVEVLSIDNYSARTTGDYSLNERDSGVQIEDQTPSPKDSDSSSDTPKSHRVDGGIIFSRPKLPEKRDVQIEYVRKGEATRNLIRDAIEKNDFLNNFMDKERKEMVIDAMSQAFYEKDRFIINENEEGSEIFVSEEGEFDVIKNGKIIGSFGAGTLFGELAILYNAKRFASVKAATYARVWKISRETFRKIMIISGSREREENLNFLRSVPFLRDLNEEVLSKVVDLLQRKFYEANSCIVREGEVGNEFFIIRGGTVTIKKKNEHNVERIVDRRKRGDYFGEQALLNADCRQASVYADGPGTEVLRLDREAFNSYLGTIPQLREKPVERFPDDSGPNSPIKTEFDNPYAHLELTELKKIATLGAGAFGKVDLVSYGEKTFALKIIKKIDIIKQDQVDHIYSEKEVMMKCSDCPFIIELYKTYRNEKFVYFLMEACMGGDVWTVMSQRRFFDEKTARFISGCVVEAFDFLHSHNIIYRDLKPENLMLTTDGYCKLVDFGFAKRIPINQKTNTFAGTPEYVAPEIILDRGHDRAVDYWALGILVFELLVGKTPFRGQSQIKIYQQILGGIDVIQMPSKIPKSAQGLIKSLCKQSPAERLGYQRRGILDIKKHSWFESLDWQKLQLKQLPSPIKRPITSNTDVQYFLPAGVDNDHDPPDETSGWDIDF